jgi:YndJ-like protein
MSTVPRLVLALGLRALAGLVVWLVIAAVAMSIDTAALDLVTVLLLFGQLVVVPLGLLLVPASGHRLADALARGGRSLFRIGGLAAIASLAIPRGELSAAIAAIYLVPALLVASASCLRARTIRGPSDLAAVAAGISLLIGALFFVLHRQDVAFAGLPELMLQVSAVHFHFTGFGLVLMAGALGRRSPRLGTVAVFLLVGGTLLTPIGLLVGPALRVVAAAAVVAGLAALIAGTFPLLGDARMPAAARRLHFVSIAFALFVGASAAWYVIGEAIGTTLIDIGVMARLHGTFAAIGVVFCGLLGWRLADGP